MAKILPLLALAALLLAACACAESQSAICSVASTPTYISVTQDPANSKISVFLYNKSATYERTGIPNAMIIRINMSDLTVPVTSNNFCYQATGSSGARQGWADFAYSPKLDGCLDYWFIFCPPGTANYKMCLNGTGLMVPSVMKPCGASAAPIAHNTQLLSHNEMYFCNQSPKNYAPLCWPLMLIAGLLIGASFAMGKNPFDAFDFSAPKMSRGRQYTMRQQQRSFDFLTYIMAAEKLGETAGKTASMIGGEKDVVANGEVKGKLDKNDGVGGITVRDKETGKVTGQYVNGQFRPAGRGGHFVDATTRVHDPGWGRYTSPMGWLKMGAGAAIGGIAGLFRSDTGRDVLVDGKAVGKLDANGNVVNANGNIIGHYENGKLYFGNARMGMRSTDAAIDYQGTVNMGNMSTSELAGKIDKESGGVGREKSTSTMKVAPTRLDGSTLMAYSWGGLMNIDKSGSTELRNFLSDPNNGGVFAFLFEKMKANIGLGEANDLFEKLWRAYSALSYLSAYMKGPGGKGAGIKFLDQLNDRLVVARMNLGTMASWADPNFATAGASYRAYTSELLAPFSEILREGGKDLKNYIKGGLDTPDGMFMGGAYVKKIGISFTGAGKDVAILDESGNALEGERLKQYLKDHGLHDDDLLLKYLTNDKEYLKNNKEKLDSRSVLKNIMDLGNLGENDLETRHYKWTPGDGNKATKLDTVDEYERLKSQWATHIEMQSDLSRQLFAAKSSPGDLSVDRLRAISEARTLKEGELNSIERTIKEYEEHPENSKAKQDLEKMLGSIGSLAGTVSQGGLNSDVLDQAKSWLSDARSGQSSLLERHNYDIMKNQSDAMQMQAKLMREIEKSDSGFESMGKVMGLQTEYRAWVDTYSQLASAAYLGSGALQSGGSNDLLGQFARGTSEEQKEIKLKTDEEIEKLKKELKGELIPQEIQLKKDELKDMQAAQGLMEKGDIEKIETEIQKKSVDIARERSRAEGFLACAQLLTQAQESGMERVAENLSRVNEELKKNYPFSENGETPAQEYIKQLESVNYLLGKRGLMDPTDIKSRALLDQAQHLFDNSANPETRAVFDEGLARTCREFVGSFDYNSAVLENSGVDKNGRNVQQQLQDAFNKEADLAMEQIRSKADNPEALKDIENRLDGLIKIEQVLYQTSEKYIDESAKGSFGAITSPVYLGSSDQEYQESNDIYKRFHAMVRLPGQSDSDYRYGDIKLSVPERGSEPSVPKDSWHAEIPDIGGQPVQNKPVEPPRLENVPHYERFMSPGNESSTFTYVPGLDPNSISEERKARWGFTKYQELDEEKQDKLTAVTNDFLLHNKLATEEQLRIFEGQQIAWNSNAKAYELVRGVQGGLDDEQLALWIKHNDTLTIRGRKFADAEFKPTLNSLSSGTPDQRADELMKFVVENPEQLVKDQDVPYKYKYGTATKTARMNDQDKEIVTERVERVIDVYQSWKKSEEKQ